MKFRISIFAALVLLASSVVQAAATPVMQLDTGGHVSRIWDVTFTPDGSRLISAGDDKVVRIWNLRTGSTERIIRGLVGPGVAGKIQSMALSPDGRTLAVGVYFPHNAGAEDQTVLDGDVAGFLRLYDIETGTMIGRLVGHKSSVLGLAFSRDSRFLVSGGGKRTNSNTVAIVWDVAGRKPLHYLKGHKSEIYAVGFTSDGERVVTGSDDRTLMLWNLQSGKRIRKMKGHDDAVRALSISPAGDYIASGAKDRTIRLWDAKTGKARGTLATQDSQVTALSFSVDGKRIVSASGLGDSLDSFVYDVQSGEKLITYQGHNAVVLATATSPDGRWVATGGGDHKQIDVWSIDDGTRLHQLVGQGSTTWAVGFSFDGTRLAWGKTKDVQDRNDRGPLEHEIRLPDSTRSLGRPGSVVDGSDFVRAQTALGDLRLKTEKSGKYNYRSILEVENRGKRVAKIRRTANNGYAHTAYTLTPDGKMIISGGANGWLSAYDTAGNALGEFHGHTGTITGLAVSPDGQMLASSSYDQTVRLWNVANGELLATLFHSMQNEWVIWTTTGHYAASPHGDRHVGWQINRGVDQAAEYVFANQLGQQLYRPAFIDKVLRLRSTEQALFGISKAVFKVQELSDERIRPPRFEVVSPQDQATVTESELNVTLSIDNSDNPVKSLSAYVNGRQVTTRAMSEKSLRVPIDAGENKIRIVARNRVGESEQVITVHLDKNSKVAPRGRGKLIVVAIGVNDYANLPQDLRFASNDARGITTALKRQNNVLFDEVETILVTDGVMTPTKANIEQALTSFQSAGPDDTVILFVAGHGVMQDDDYFFLPHEAEIVDGERLNTDTAIRWRTFQDALARSAGRRILLVDTCHASNAFNPRLVKDAADQDIVVITSTDGETLAQEDERYGHGVFTYALLEGLKGRADTFKDGRVTITELHTYLTNRVESLTDMTQRPVLHVPGGFKNFVFSKL